jgi:hypothetical protein
MKALSFGVVLSWRVVKFVMVFLLTVTLGLVAIMLKASP